MKKIISLFFLTLIMFCVFSCKKEDKLVSVSYILNGGDLDNTNKYLDTELPVAKKEGYIFIGWAFEGVFAESMNGKYEELEAVFVEPFEYTDINDDMIFNQEDTEYFVYIYRDGCSWCSKIKNDILTYIYKSSQEEYKSSIKVYPINLTKNGNRSKMFKTYSESDYDEGFEGFYVNRAKKYDDIYIASTPALFKVNASNESISVTILANGASKVVSELNKGLRLGKEEISKRPQYMITYQLNGGTLSEDAITKFYSWSKAPLPSATKDGFIFLGWYVGDERIVELDNKNYVLEAKWAELITPEVIKADQIFNEANRYICFINYELEYYNELVNVISKYNLLFNEKVVFVDILDVDAKLIKRSYQGEDGQSSIGRFFVDGVMVWTELYIPKAPGLILIENGIAKYITDGRDIIEYFEKILSE